MKISALIQSLSEILSQEGDLEVYSAIDDEMNGFNSIEFDPTVFWGMMTGTRSNRLDSVVGLDDMNELDEENYTKVVII